MAGKKVGLILSGGNVDPGVYARALARLDAGAAMAATDLPEPWWATGSRLRGGTGGNVPSAQALEAILARLDAGPDASASFLARFVHCRNYHSHGMQPPPT